MSEKPVNTVHGPFTRERLKTMKDLIAGEDRDTVLQFEGADLLVKYAQYLVEFVEGEFAKRNHGGL